MNLHMLILLLLFTVSAFAEDFCFGFLNSHPDRKQIPTAEAEKIQQGHLAHMTSMAKAGHLLAAGPFLTPGGPRGVVAYRCSSLEQATEWTAKDPAIINKRLSLDLHLWRGPNNFGEPLAASLKTDPNAKYEMVRLPFILFKKTSSWVNSGPVEILVAERTATQTLRKQGLLRIEGPFLDSPAFAALWVLRDMPLEEAVKLAKASPLVHGGYASVEAYMWMVANESIPKPQVIPPQ